MCSANARAVLEVELVGPAFLRRQRGHVSPLDRIAENTRAEFFVDEDPGTGARHALVERLSEAVIDHPLALGDDVVFISRERRGELEHAGHVGMTMIERQQVQRAGVAECHVDTCAKSLVTSACASVWIRSRCARSRKLSA